MVTVTFYKMTSAANVVNKAISEIATVTGVFKTPTSMLDPVLIIEHDNGEIWRKGYNYLYIKEFNRYYYVTNLIAVQGSHDIDPAPVGGNPRQLWEVHAHVDVLMSFQDEIKAQTAIVARQEATYNLMLDDGVFMCYQNPKIQTKLFSNPTPFETQEFVLIVAGS